MGRQLGCISFVGVSRRGGCRRRRGWICCSEVVQMSANERPLDQEQLSLGFRSVSNAPNSAYRRPQAACYFALAKRALSSSPLGGLVRQPGGLFEQVAMLIYHSPESQIRRDRSIRTSIHPSFEHLPDHSRALVWRAGLEDDHESLASACERNFHFKQLYICYSMCSTDSQTLCFNQHDRSTTEPARNHSLCVCASAR